MWMAFPAIRDFVLVVGMVRIVVRWLIAVLVVHVIMVVHVSYW